MKKLIHHLKYVSILILVLTFCNKVEHKNNIAAIIGNDTITVAETDSNCLSILREKSNGNPFWKTPTPKQLKLYRKLALTELVRESIVKQEAKKLGIKIDSLQADKEFEIFLTKKFKNNIEDIKKLLDKFNQPLEVYRKQYYTRLLFNAVKESLVKPIAFPEDSIDYFVKTDLSLTRQIRRKVSHICLYKKLSYVYEPKKKLKRIVDILKAQDSTLAGKRLKKAQEYEVYKERKKIKKIFNKLKNGERFETLVQKYSEDTISVKRDGYVKKIPLGYRYPPYSDVAFSLKTGSYSNIVETPFGFFIIRADAPIETTFVPVELAKQKLREKLNRNKYTKVINDLFKSKKPIILMDTASVPDYLLKRI